MCRSVKMKAITKLLSKTAGRQKEFSLDMSKIETKFIDSLNRSKVDLIKKYYLGDMEEKYLNIVGQIYRENNEKCLVGKEAK